MRTGYGGGSRGGIAAAVAIATTCSLAPPRHTAAQRSGLRDSGDAGAVFESMAVNESKHGEQLAERRLALFGADVATFALSVFAITVTQLVLLAGAVDTREIKAAVQALVTVNPELPDKIEDLDA